jgi:hypothetical protein
MNLLRPLHRALSCAFAATMLLPVIAPAEPAPFTHFVTRSSDKLFEGSAELRFISTNMPDILQVITNTGFESTSPNRLPDAYELRDAVVTVKQMGGQVLRTFTITAKNGPSAEHFFNVATSPVTPNEAGLQVLDRLLQICNEEGIRVYIPLIAYSNTNRGDPSTYGPNFWTVGSFENLKFKDMISQLLNRTNSFTGIQYKNDKAILGWQSGNELVIGTDTGRRAWLHDLAAYVKGIDGNHLFIDGRNKPDDIYNLYDEFFTDPNIDVVSYHTYVNLAAFNTPATTLQAMRQYTAGKKSLIVSEIAMYTTESALATLLDQQIANGTTGSNWWGHRFRNREGGFYRHSDNGSLFEDLNWPGFPGSAAYLPEIQKALNLQDIIASRAYAIQGLVRPLLPVPAAPLLLPIDNVGHLSWEGPTGAQAYDIERAPAPSGPWAVIASDYPEHMVVADSLFCDETAEGGATYYYRIIAKNTSGASLPSNVVGPVTVGSNWLVDDFFDLSRTFSATNVQINKAYNHYNYSNDLALLIRSSSSAPGEVVYCLDGYLKGVTAYLHQSTVAPSFSGSTDGITFVPLTPTFLAFGSRKLYLATAPEGSIYRYLKIGLNTPATSEAVGRVEIEYVQPAGTVRSPTFAPAAGLYPSAQTVTLATTTPGASIRYTTNGSTPTATSGTLYSGPITIDASATLKAVAYRSGLADSFVSVGTYAIGATPQTLLLEAEDLSPIGVGAGVSVETDGPASAGRWSKLNGSAVGHYTEFTTPAIPAGTYSLSYRYKTGGPRAQYSFALDGAILGGTIDPYATTSFYLTIEMGTVSFPTTATHKIRLVVTGKNPASSGYLIGSDAFTFIPLAAVAAPVFNLPAGLFHSPQSITLETATPGASIRYTLDGSTPSATVGALYAGPFTLSSTATIKAVAFKADMADSVVTVSSYDLVDNTPPVIAVPAAITVQAPGADGAAVTYTTSATDDFDGLVAVDSSHPSGSIFPVGITTVLLHAQDAAGNLATASFTVTVTAPMPEAPSLTITRGGYLLNRRTNLVTQQVTLTNSSAQPVTGQIFLILDALSGNTTLVNASGSTGGRPYLAVPNDSLAPGSSVSVTLQFANPASGGITYDPHVASSL